MSLDAAQRRALLSSPAGWLALGLGAGLSPWAPGTVGSLAALLPWLALRQLPWPGYLAVLVLAFVLGVWACGKAGKAIGVADHGAYVWDEFVGQWLALLPCLWLPGWWWVALSFGLFRLFDILKPGPVGWADRACHGGFGVMLDDALAGLMAALTLALAIAWLA
ncbi:MAG TPA: phosphatidylglycerophosphatase A [Rhodanobacteraceae bacterium]|nr:phosphatidylglycerophosphatase A [Rhodanobacteraceae bacterium]